MSPFFSRHLPILAIVTAVSAPALVATSAMAQTAPAAPAQQRAVSPPQGAAAGPMAGHRATCFDAPYGSQEWQRCEQNHPTEMKREHRMGQRQQRRD